LFSTTKARVFGFVFDHKSVDFLRMECPVHECAEVFLGFFWYIFFLNGSVASVI
jgi:hypothetical protein